MIRLIRKRGDSEVFHRPSYLHLKQFSLNLVIILRLDLCIRRRERECTGPFTQNSHDWYSRLLCIDVLSSVPKTVFMVHIFGKDLLNFVLLPVLSALLERYCCHSRKNPLCFTVNPTQFVCCRSFP